MNSKSRNLYIDVMKGLLIILVVIGHLPFFEYDSRTLTLIYSFHMHAFLIIGGILSRVNEKSKLTIIITRKIKNILFPYFVFYIISLIIIPSPSPEQKLKAIIVMFRGIGDPINAINLPLWFLTFYFVALVLYETIVWLSYKIYYFMFNKSSLIKDSNKNQNTQNLFITFFTLILVSTIMYFSYLYARVYKLPRIPFNIEIAGFCLGFVFIGQIISRYLPDAISEIKKNTFTKILGSILTIILLIIFIYSWYKITMNNGRIDLNARDYKNAFLMYVDAILAFTIFAIFSFMISKIPLVKSLLGVIGENSIYILAYHVPSVIITNGFITPSLPSIIQIMLAHNSIFSITILSLLGIVISLVAALLHKCIRFSA